MDISQYDWIKQKYDGIIEIYPTKCLNSDVFKKVLFELQQEYYIIKIFNDYYKGFKREAKENE